MLIANQRKSNYSKERTIKNKRKKRKVKSNNIFLFKSLFSILFLFALSLMLIFQHTKITTANNELMRLEKELKEIQMLNDSKEGELLGSQDLNIIEEIAKKELGMVEAKADQYTYIAVIKNNGIFQVENIEDTRTDSILANSDVLSWLTHLID